jgi:hypothetical protein
MQIQQITEEIEKAKGHYRKLAADGAFFDFGRATADFLRDNIPVGEYPRW